jgi:predicted metal-binding protein
MASHSRDPTKLVRFEPMMDRSISPLSDNDAVTELPRPLPSAPVVVSVCVNCKASDGAVVGSSMLDAVTAALDARDVAVIVRPVQCLSVCKRPTTAAVTSPDGYTFLFGDLLPDSGASALADFVQSYQKSDYGLVPWRERAEVLRKGMVARVPPLRWSPADGRPPK